MLIAHLSSYLNISNDISEFVLENQSINTFLFFTRNRLSLAWNFFCLDQFVSD